MKLIDQATAQVEASYDEPSLQEDGSPLVDLAYTSVYYSPVLGPILVGQAPTLGPVVVGAKVNASAVTGGGSIATTLIVPAPTGTTSTFAFQASATDLTGTESAKTPAVFFVIDRVSPATPRSFTVA